MNIIGHRKIFLSVSGILVLMSVAAILIFGFKPGIDFVGGTLWHVKIVISDKGLVTPQQNKFATGQASDNLKDFFEKDLGLKNVTVFPASDSSFLIRLPHLSEPEHQSYLNQLKAKFGEVEEIRFESIGPTVGEELRKKAFWAIGLVLLGISLYVAFAFRKVSYPIKSWKYGLITLITLFHDITIPAGLFSVLGWKLGLEVDTNFIVALLTIMGFSVHDTIVVFDRIRENLLFGRQHLNLENVVNQSVNQTLARSINTSLTLILVLIALFFFGPATLKYFVLTILIGTIVGTYSSIFVASPLLLIINSQKNKGV